MQLHPAVSKHAIMHSIASLAAGYIGLDFAKDVGDLTKTTQEKLPEKQRHFWAFADKMKVGDIVLIMAHFYPFALCAISGEYEYKGEKPSEAGVWFKHSRKVKHVKYYQDYLINPETWKKILMIGTISPVKDPNSPSFKLIEEWLK